MSNENAKIDDNYKKSLTAVSDDALREIKKLLVDPITGRLKVQITGANKSKKQEVFNETGGTLSQNRFVKVVGDNNLYLIPNVDYVSSLNDIPVGFLTVDFLDGSRAEPLIRGRVEIAGFDTSTANIGDPVYSDENGNPTLFPTGLEVGQVLTPATNGVIFINLGAKTDIVEKMTTATDPATNAAVTQTIVDHFIGVIITLTTTGNSQTIASPTLTTKIGKKFTVVNNDTSTNSIVVNGQTIEAGEATTFMWDGSAWIYVDINENLFEIAGSVIRPITDGNDLDMRTGTITTPTLYANTINEKTLNSGVTVDGVLIKDGEVDGRDISVDGNNLDSHISNTLNPHSVTATQVGLGNVTNESKTTMFTNPTFTGHVTVPTPTDGTDAVTKNYADGLVVGLWDDRGSYDASGNNFPATGGSGTAGAILKGDIWTISVAGTLGGVAVNIGDTVRAVIDTPGQTSSNWALLENNIGYVPENIANKVVSISALSTDTEYPSAKCIFDELALKQNVLSKASGSDIDTGTDDTKYVTSKAIADSKLSFTDGVETLTNKTLTLPTFTNGTINFNAPQGFLINGKIVRNVANLVTNNSFETDLTDYEIYGNSTNTRVTSTFRTGSASMQCVLGSDLSSAGGFAGAKQTGVGLTVGKTYTASCYVKGAVGGELFNIYAQHAGNIQKNITLTTSWQRVEITFVASYINYDIFFRGLTPNSTFYIDDVQIDEGTYATTFTTTAGNMTVAIKTLAGNDPSATDPVYCRIGNTVRSITSALSTTHNAGTSWLNLGSSELATKEVDLFVYLFWNTNLNAVNLVSSRYPGARYYGDFTNSQTAEKGLLLPASIATTDECEVVGRYNIIMSAGPTYTWSIPATDIIINKWDRDTKKNSWVSVLSVGVGSVSSSTLEYATYTIKNHILHFELYGYFVSNNAITNDFIFSLPFKELNSYIPVSCMADVPSTGQRVLRGYIFNSSCKVLLEVPLTSGQTALFRISGDYEI